MNIFNVSFKKTFNELSKDIIFEIVAKGRKGAILVNDSNKIPLVRSTTMYHQRAQKFKPIHYELLKMIKETSNLKVSFNNILIEIYNNDYRDMSFHTDQSQDLEQNSYICIYSCYSDENHNRVLVVEEKDNEKDTEKDPNKEKEKTVIPLLHNSVVLFDTQYNKSHRHKIKIVGNTSNEWLGLTFRMSKTFIEFINEIPYLGPKKLVLADEYQKKLLYHFRNKENKEIECEYPEFYFTLSPSDLLNVL